MKPSAYRSMSLARQGKTDPKNKGGLKRWIEERWINLTPYAFNVVSLKESPKCGDSSLNPVIGGVRQKSVCRPMRTVSRQTPTLASAYTKKQIRRAIEMKNKGERINWAGLGG